jgi:group II intron reverse transcriptase/maturase
VATVVQAVYEQDFLDCSYGFRPGRSAHQALQSLREGLMKIGGGVVIDVDVRSYFDTIDHSHLRGFLDRRVCDGVIRRQIDKWLKAGVVDGRERIFPTAGTPQGGVISPLLANIFLHEVLDRWFEETVRPRLEGEAFLIRYADDFVIACALDSDARRIMAVLPKRFGKYGLTIHPEKTRMIDLRRHRSTDRRGKGSFYFLGFTHLWARSRKGHWVIKRQTARSRLTRSLAKIAKWCSEHRHSSMRLQHAVLSRKSLWGTLSTTGLPETRSRSLASVMRSSGAGASGSTAAASDDRCPGTASRGS